MKRVFSITMLMLIGVFSCNSFSSLSPASYVSFLEAEQNHFTKKVIAGATEYTLQLGTPAYMATKEFGNGSNMKGFQERIRELGGYLFFLIRISPASEEAKERGVSYSALPNAEEMIMYYQQQAAADMHLVIGDSVLSPSAYQFENNYGLSPYNTIVAAFRVPEQQSHDLQFVFNDRFTSQPLIKATFSASSINNIPSIRLNN